MKPVRGCQSTPTSPNCHSPRFLLAYARSNQPPLMMPSLPLWRSYLPLQSPPAVNSTLPAPEEPTISVDAVDKVTHLMRLVGELAKQVERLQQNDDEQSHARGYERRRGPPTGPRRRFLGQCWNCQQTGHRSRDCLQPRRQQNQQQEN